MSERKLVLDREGSSTPLKEWLERQPDDLRLKCLERLDLLLKHWNQLRRPRADLLEDGIYELRLSHRGNRYRILYFFDGPRIVVLTHAFLKNRARVPRGEIRRARRYRELYLEDRSAHSTNLRKRS